jgi:hypothetical protein
MVNDALSVAIELATTWPGDRYVVPEQSFHKMGTMSDWKSSVPS